MQLSKQQRWLIAFLSSDLIAMHELEPLAGAEWHALVDYSKEHLLTPILYHQMKTFQGNVHIPGDVLQRLHGMYLQSVARSIRLRSELSHALKAIARQGIPCMLLKGAHLQEFVYADIGLRMMEDVDILFHKEDLKRVQACLIEEGYLQADSPLQIDAHWYIEQYLNIDMKTIWDSARPSDIDGNSVFILPPEYLLVHLCVHLSFHHQFRFAGLRTLYDIKQAAVNLAHELDWLEVARCAEEWGVKNGVYLTLLLARDMAGAPIPDGFLEGLKPKDFSCEYKRWAMRQIFQKKEEEFSLSPYFWQIWKTRSVVEKLSLVMKLMFPDKAFLSQKYSSSGQRKSGEIYYLVRIKDHMRRYFRILWKIIIRDEAALKLLREKQQTCSMMEWLAASGDRLL